MATVSYLLQILETDTANSANTTGRQLYYSSGENAYTNLDKMGPITIASNPASPVNLFPSHLNITAGQRITMTFKVTYHSSDNTNALRLMTWLADGVLVETVKEFGSFSFDTSLTLDRAGNQSCTLELWFEVT